jgi:hypothetical protein
MAEIDDKTIKIDEKEFEIELLSDAAKGQIVNLRVVDQEIVSIQQKLAIAQTARNAYGVALRKELPDDE